MRFPIFCIVAVLISAAADGRSSQTQQEELKGSLPRPEEARDAVAILERGVSARTFIAQALQNERLDLLELCWETPGINPYMLGAFAKAEDSPFKDQLLLRLLRNPVKKWLGPDEFLRSGTITNETHAEKMERSAIAEALMPHIKKVLPDTVFNYETISSAELRHTLADAYEAKLAKLPPADQVGSNPVPPEQATEVKQVSADTKNPPKETEPNQPKSTKAITPTQYLLWTLAVLAGLGAFAFVIKRKSE